jgi:transketolase
MSYYAALQRKNGPSTLIFSRQNLPALTRPASFSPDDVLKGGYIVREASAPKLVIVATGSEVATAIEAAELLEAEGTPTRVVSMPCVELFKAQDAQYKAKILPADVKTAVVEAGTTVGWRDLLGRDLFTVGIDHYGASAPGELLAEKFGLTGKSVKEKIAAWL